MQGALWVIVSLLAALTAGCASTTMSTVAGVCRNQFIWAPASGTDDFAKKTYEETKTRAKQEGRLNVDAQLTNRVRRIAERVHAQVGAVRTSALSWEWEVNVIMSEQVNAFGQAGGKIMIMSGMITDLSLSDDEIAVAIGHETAHSLREHTRERVSYAALMAGLKRASNKDLKQLPDSNFRYPHPAAAEMEIEADLIGMELAARAGYRMTAALSWIEKLKQNANGRPTTDDGAHPGYERRKHRINEAIRAMSTSTKPTC